MPQQPVRPPAPDRRVAWRVACRVATVLGPVLVVGVPVGAVAARDPVPATRVLARPAPAAPQAAAPAPQVASAAAVVESPGEACPGGAARSSGWARAASPTSGGPRLVTLTFRHPAPRPAALGRLRTTAVCLAAPSAPGGAQVRRVLPPCGAATVARPCVTGREVVRATGGWVPRVTFRLPAGYAGRR